jgi:hypothetical protein
VVGSDERGVQQDHGVGGVVQARGEEQLRQRHRQHDDRQRPGEQQEELVGLLARERGAGQAVRRGHADQQGQHERPQADDERVAERRHHPGRGQEGAQRLQERSVGRNDSGNALSDARLDTAASVIR